MGDSRDTREDVAARLRRLREGCGNPAFGKIHDALLKYDIDKSGQAIGNYHQGKGPEPAGMDVDLMVGLAAFYSRPLSYLSPTVAARAQRLAMRYAEADSYAAGDSNPEPSDSDKYPEILAA